MLPLLQAVADGKEHLVRDLVDVVSDRFALTVEERAQLVPSGQTVISNRVGWARTELKLAGLLETPSRGYIRITQRGKEVLAKNPEHIDTKFLRQFPEYLDFLNRSNKAGSPKDTADVEPATTTPKEQIDAAYKALRGALAKEVLDRVRGSTPSFFEEIVVRLLVAMGYGGSLADAGRRIGKAGDGGIDGIIKEDRLGLDVVCIQAKRWEGTVGRPVVQAFVGSMEMYRARKGVLLTTSCYSADALEYINKIESKKVVLIDGETLADLMIDYNVGVAVAETYLVKKIDLDFFDEGLE